MTHREPLKPLLRVGRTSGRGFQGGCGCSVWVGSGPASCWFWLPHLAQDPRTGGLAPGWACTWDTRCPRVSLVHSEVESKAGCSPPVPGTGCGMHTGMQLAGQISPAWGSGLRAQGSLLQEAAGDNHCHLQLFGHTNLHHPPLSLSGVSILHVLSLVSPPP